MADDIVVDVENLVPEIDVEVAAVGLQGPEGPVGPSGSSDFTPVLQAHIDSPTPHPVYDDGPLLTLLYENAKV